MRESAVGPTPVTAGQVTYGSAQGRRVLWATVLGSGLGYLDGTIVNVALPRIGESLHAGLTSLQWIANGYTLALSGLLLLGGSLGDRLGRRRIFVLGVMWFTVASLGCAAAPSAPVLIGLRVLQGVGAALLTPGSLAILQSVFRPSDRARAVGAWSGLGGVATALGPVVGGVLIGIGDWGWRLAFLINLPLAAAVVWMSRRYIPEVRDAGATGRVDVLGTVLAAVGLAGVVYGLTEGPGDGWSGWMVGSVAVGAGLLVAFVLSQRNIRNPLLPLELFRNRQFTGANLATLAVYAALTGTMFLLPLQLQVVTGFSPLAAGTATLPFTGVLLLLSAKAGQLASRIGPRLPMTVGPIVAGAGMALLAVVGAGSSYLAGVLPGVMVFAIGMAITIAPLTATVLAAAPISRAGIASAINNAVARVAGLLAVAVLPGLSGITPAAYSHPAALSAGFSRAVIISGALCAFGGVLAYLTIRNPTRIDR